mmetsp:Transcript_8638/g.23721  ORF Transcript_8638/g.23721 Transcript_8638/m.23721 type:complete len:216 (-) Transcript_8638:349-996(-)
MRPPRLPGSCAIVSCLRCDEQSSPAELPRCGCFVRLAIQQQSPIVRGIVTGAPRRPRKVRLSADGIARRRGVLARDVAFPPQRIPEWFRPAKQALTVIVKGEANVPVYIEARVRTRQRDRPEPYGIDITAHMDFPVEEEINVGKRTFRRSFILTIPAKATLADVKTVLAETHNVECSILAKYSTTQRVTVEFRTGQYMTAAMPFFSHPGDALIVW